MVFPPNLSEAMPNLVHGQSISQNSHLSRPPKRKLTVASAGFGTPAINRRKNDDIVEVLKAPFCKIVNVQYGFKMIKKVIVFTRDDPKLCYEYSLYTSVNQTYCCQRCKLQGIRVKLQLFENTADGDYVKLSSTSHRCEPQIYDPSKYAEIVNKTIPKKLTNYEFNTFTKADGSKIRNLTIIDFKNKNVCYTLNYDTTKRLYRCYKCKMLSKNVSVKLYRNEANELCFKYGKNGHVCLPQTVAITIDAANFEIVKGANGKFKNLTIFTSGSRELCYRYHWTNGNYFRCNGCLKLKSQVPAKLFEKQNGEYYVKMNQHKCEPIRCSEFHGTQG